MKERCPARLLRVKELMWCPNTAKSRLFSQKGDMLGGNLSGAGVFGGATCAGIVDFNLPMTGHGRARRWLISGRRAQYAATDVHTSSHFERPGSWPADFQDLTDRVACGIFTGTRESRGAGIKTRAQRSRQMKEI